jgi:hypothetical protein
MKHDNDIKNYAFYLSYALAAETAKDNQKATQWMKRALEIKKERT